MNPALIQILVGFLSSCGIFVFGGACCKVVDSMDHKSRGWLFIALALPSLAVFGAGIVGALVFLTKGLIYAITGS